MTRSIPERPLEPPERNHETSCQICGEPVSGCRVWTDDYDAVHDECLLDYLMDRLKKSSYELELVCQALKLRKVVF